MRKQYNAVVSGYQGYIGQALLTLINQHEYLQLFAVHGREKTLQLPENSANVPVYSLEDIIHFSSEIDILFLATPASVSMETVAALSEKNIKIIDLSGAFRLPEQQFTSWYGISHIAKEFINKACYGLTPWVNTQRNHQLIANPGCYATGILMTLLPLCKYNVIQTNSVIIDAKSGVSGSGKQANPDLMFCEIANNFFPYKIGKHQHTPEILNALQNIGGKQVDIRLTTSILPIISGIALTIYATAELSFTSDAEISIAINHAFQEAYHDYAFVRHQEVGKKDENSDRFILSLKNVLQTPYCHIGYHVKNGQITLFSYLDNLLKGAATQAIENFNAMYQLPLHTGLLPVKGEI